MMSHQPDSLRLVFWELTARCNLHCQHCRAEAQEHFAKGELTLNELAATAAAIRQAGDPIVILTGGEPLARDDFFDHAKTCSQLFSRVALATNGTLVDADTARRIVQSGIKRVSISLDGADAATHDSFRGESGSFDQALRGYHFLRDAGVSMQINVTITQHNAHQLEQMLQQALELQADAFHVFMLVPVGCGAEMDSSQRLDAAHSEKLLRWLFDQSLALQGQMHLKATCAPQYYRIRQEIIRERGLKQPKSGHGMQAVTRGCLAGSAVCFISRTGDVQPCGYLPLAAGNVRDTPFRDIWNQSEIFRKLRDPDQLHGKCGACGFRKICQGCRARAYAVTGDFLQAEPDCAYIPANFKPDESSRA